MLIDIELRPFRPPAEGAAPLAALDPEHPHSPAQLFPHHSYRFEQIGTVGDHDGHIEGAAEGIEEEMGRQIDVRPFSSGTHTSAVRGPPAGVCTSHCRLACSTSSPKWIVRRGSVDSASRYTSCRERCPARPQDGSRRAVKKRTSSMTLRGRAEKAEAARGQAL